MVRATSAPTFAGIQCGINGCSNRMLQSICRTGSFSTLAAARTFPFSILSLAVCARLLWLLDACYIQQHWEKTQRTFAKFRMLLMLVCRFTLPGTQQRAWISAKNGQTDTHRKCTQYEREYRILLQWKLMAINFVVAHCSSDINFAAHADTIDATVAILPMHTLIMCGRVGSVCSGKSSCKSIDKIHFNLCAFSDCAREKATALNIFDCIVHTVAGQF